jgi:hypothetical protein
MISKGRIITIFRKNSGSAFTMEELSQSDKDFLDGKLKGGEALVANIQSSVNWFAITASELVSSVENNVRSIPLSEITGIVPRTMNQFVRNKRSGGTLELKLRDGSMLALHLEGGKLFMAMLNASMYIVKMNLGQRHVSVVKD